MIGQESRELGHKMLKYEATDREIEALALFENTDELPGKPIGLVQEDFNEDD